MASESSEGRLPKVGIPTSVTVRTDGGLGLHIPGRVLACCCGLNVNCPPQVHGNTQFSSSGPGGSRSLGVDLEILQHGPILGHCFLAAGAM